MDDLNRVARFKNGCAVRLAREDGAVQLHDHSAGTDSKLFEQQRHAEAFLDFLFFAVDLNNHLIKKPHST